MQVALHTVSPLLGAAKGALDVVGPLTTTAATSATTAMTRPPDTDGVAPTA